MSTALVHVPRRRGFRLRPMLWTDVKWQVEGQGFHSAKVMAYVFIYGEEFAYVDTWRGTAFVPFRMIEPYHDLLPYQRSFQDIMAELAAKLK